MHRSLAVVIIFVSSTLTLDAQEPVQPLQETKVVLRISRRFIQRLTGVRFQQDRPIDSNLDGTRVTGLAHVTGKFKVEFIESDNDTDFDVLVSGEVDTQLTATRRPVVVLAHGSAPFSAKRRFDHTADGFITSKVEIDVHNQFVLDEICPFRSGLAGAASGRIARPFVRRGLSDGDRKAEAQIRAELGAALERELDKLAQALDRIPPLVKQAHEIIIAENKLPPEGVRFYRAATKDYFLISVGKPDRRIPTLPMLAKEKQAPLELWIGESKKADKEERRKFMLQNWRLIVPILTAQLERRSLEMAKEIDEPLTRMLDEVQIHDVAGWHVVTFAPRIQLPVVEIP